MYVYVYIYIYKGFVAKGGGGEDLLKTFPRSPISAGATCSRISLQAPSFNTCHRDKLPNYPAIPIRNPISTKPPLRNAPQTRLRSDRTSTLELESEDAASHVAIPHS